MPSKHVVRSFAENQFYHVFNRGVEKRKIFIDQQDYQIFKYYIFIYVSPLKTVLEKYPQMHPRLQSKNLHDQIDLIAYCLMPNHFHLLMKQTPRNAISKFMKQLTNAYTEYFNSKYKRVGALMQGRFKAARTPSEDIVAHVSRYIHLNPLVAGMVDDLNKYPWSSYLEYVSREGSLCRKDILLNRFKSSEKYAKFVQSQVDYAKELDKIKHLAID